MTEPKKLFETRPCTEEELHHVGVMGAKFFQYSPYSKLFEFDPESPKAMVRGMRAEGIGECYMSFKEDGTPVGMIGVVVYPYYMNKDVLVGQELFWWIEEGYRGTAVASQLQKAAEDFASGMGAKTFAMIALVGEKIKPLERYYSRKGYKPVEQAFVKVLDTELPSRKSVKPEVYAKV